MFCENSISIKRSILDVWQDTEYAPGCEDYKKIERKFIMINSR